MRLLRLASFLLEVRELRLERRDLLARLREDRPNRDEVDVGLDRSTLLEPAFELVSSGNDISCVLELLLDPLQLLARGDKPSQWFGLLVGRTWPLAEYSMPNLPLPADPSPSETHSDRGEESSRCNRVRMSIECILGESCT